MFKWQINAVETAKALPEHVWNKWKDVPNWPMWDKELQWSRLNGPFAAGTKGTLKPKGWFASDFTITESIANAVHTDTTYMPFTTLVFTHRVEKIEDNQVKITHRLTAAGLLAPLLWLTMRFQLQKSIPQALKNLVQQIEANN